jgi:guanosine-3',5'-bis(diphosphate) 3'-pyrophosphohydrolase
MVPIAALQPVLDAIAFAATAHRSQFRNDGHTPYVSHPFRVAAIVRNAFGVADPAVLQAAVLHDTVEDTTADADDLIERFGPDVAAWVGLLSKDKRLPEDERERQFRDAFGGGPWQVQVVKLGDLCDNMLDSKDVSDAKWPKTVAKWRGYLDAIQAQLKPEARKAYEVAEAMFADVSKARH